MYTILKILNDKKRSMSQIFIHSYSYSCSIYFHTQNTKLKCIMVQQKNKKNNVVDLKVL